MSGYQIAFIAIAAVTVVSAAFVVLLPNILRSALFLAFTFLGVAGLYVLLNAEFLAAMQVLIYVGAITVLIMFAIVLTQQLMGAKIRQASRSLPLAILVAGSAFAFLYKAFVVPFQENGSMLASQPAPGGAASIQRLAEMLIQPYVLPFELASFVLLAALIGAIVIAKEDRE